MKKNGQCAMIAYGVMVQLLQKKIVVNCSLCLHYNNPYRYDDGPF